MNAGVLYLSYSGMLEPLGQSQVLAYQERLAADHPVYLISFERQDDLAHVEERKAIEDRMRAASIHWHPLRYHKRFSVLATIWDILCGIVAGMRLVRGHDLDIVHARSYVPAVMALVIKRLTGVRFVFDMRGFWADERVDGGLWPRGGRMYRIAKWLERRFLLKADHVVSLTDAAVREMQGFDYLQGHMPPMTVILTCADLARFRPTAGQQDTDFTLGYVGSAGTWYLFDAVVETFRQLLALKPEARLLIINRGGHDYIRECLSKGGIPMQAVELRAVTHAEVATQMARMHAGVFYIKPVFSKQASAPTKLGEFLGCGVPCLSNAGVGDMAEILEGGRVGVAVDAFDPATIAVGLQRLLELLQEPDIADRCVATAQQHFSLDEGVARYRSVYASLEQAR